MKQFFLFMVLASSTYAAENIDLNQCRIIDQSGTLDTGCSGGGSNRHIRCYADVEYDDGQTGRIFGGCARNYSDCWLGGDTRVESCD